MQTLFIFTHLIMIAALIIVFNPSFGVESEEAGVFKPIPVSWECYLQVKYKAFGCILKAWLTLLQGQLIRPKILSGLTRRVGSDHLKKENYNSQNEKSKYDN